MELTIVHPDQGTMVLGTKERCWSEMIGTWMKELLLHLQDFLDFGIELLDVSAYASQDISPSNFLA